MGVNENTPSTTSKAKKFLNMVYLSRYWHIENHDYTQHQIWPPNYCLDIQLSHHTRLSPSSYSKGNRGVESPGCLKVVRPYCADIDVGKFESFAAVPADDGRKIDRLKVRFAAELENWGSRYCIPRPTNCLSYDVCFMKGPQNPDLDYSNLDQMVFLDARLRIPFLGFPGISSNCGNQ